MIRKSSVELACLVACGALSLFVWIHMGRVIVEPGRVWLPISIDSNLQHVSNPLLVCATSVWFGLLLCVLIILRVNAQARLPFDAIVLVSVLGLVGGGLAVYVALQMIPGGAYRKFFDVPHLALVAFWICILSGVAGLVGSGRAIAKRHHGSVLGSVSGSSTLVLMCWFYRAVLCPEWAQPENWPHGIDLPVVLGARVSNLNRCRSIPEPLLLIFPCPGDSGACHEAAEDPMLDRVIHRALVEDKADTLIGFEGVALAIDRNTLVGDLATVLRALEGMGIWILKVQTRARAWISDGVVEVYLNSQDQEMASLSRILVSRDAGRWRYQVGGVVLGSFGHAAAAIETSKNGIWVQFSPSLTWGEALEGVDWSGTDCPIYLDAPAGDAR